MSAREKKKRRKGTFTDLRLSVTPTYIFPFSRRTMILWGLAAAVLVLLLFLFNIFVQDSVLISNGPLSSNHAAFEHDCQACHTDAAMREGISGGVRDEKCMLCHEKFGSDIGSHTFDSHYLYRSFDSRRLPVAEEVEASEMPCYNCHTEHKGRQAQITRVTSKRCLGCHDYGSFNDRHPEFAFKRDSIPDPANLKFTHGRHVKVLLGRGSESVQQTCFYCHHAETDGWNFQPISFEQSCSACHLGVANPRETPALDIKKTANRPGVATLGTIKRQSLAGSFWSRGANEAEFYEEDGAVSKSVLHHEDPWIMENLKRLRKEMYPAASPLNDLLKTSGEVAGYQQQDLYEEAVATLQTYLEGLRSHPSPDVIEQTAALEMELKVLKQRIANSPLSLGNSKFSISVAEANPDFNSATMAEYDAFVNELTGECQKCHYVDKATLLRVQTDQKYLVRSRFNHGAHIINQDCLSCHFGNSAGMSLEDAVNAPEVPAVFEKASVQNLPLIASCQNCHQADKSSNACITCHDFHPDKSNRANLTQQLN